ncbi:DUF58 domain-containing protein [Paenibacillus sp. GCM10012307]|uniref:DUF58 domain-containing protein n=1 Tax=Paenibacillus roseus TaxID=2798579 RepID=A0A934J1X2_9BACL|nr:DUF58 domain-containing protein [Paenibacillus roseus]MBJ6359958.1 DUF58 domain-containing protein [Paenibacillus roseus]
MNIHWILLMALLVSIGQSAVYTYWGKRRLSYSRSFSTDRCFQGDQIEMVEQIANYKLLPLPWLRVESLLHIGLRFERQANLEISEGQFMQNHKSLFSLLPYTKITRRHKITCVKRGVYRMDAVSLTCGDALGMNSTSKRIHVGSELKVYPKPLPLSELSLPTQSWHGERIVKRWIVEDPFMTAGTREYRYGDSMKGVNWKATARTGALQVHKRDYTADNRLMIVINIEDHERMWNTVKEQQRVEWAISYAAGVASYAASQGMEFGFLINACQLDRNREPVRMEPQGGQAQLKRLLDTMAELLIELSMPFDELLQKEAEIVQQRVGYLVISAFLSDSISSQLDRLRRAGHDVQWLPLRGEAVYDKNA